MIEKTNTYLSKALPYLAWTLSPMTLKYCATLLSGLRDVLLFNDDVFSLSSLDSDSSVKGKSKVIIVKVVFLSTLHGVPNFNANKIFCFLYYHILSVCHCGVYYNLVFPLFIVFFPICVFTFA